MRPSCARRIVSGTSLSPGASLSGFVWPGIGFLDSIASRLRRQRIFNELIAPHRRGVYGAYYWLRLRFEQRQLIRSEHSERELTIFQVLLIGYVLIGSNHHVEVPTFGGIQQIAIHQSAPPQFRGYANTVV